MPKVLRISRGIDTPPDGVEPSDPDGRVYDEIADLVESMEDRRAANDGLASEAMDRDRPEEPARSVGSSDVRDEGPIGFGPSRRVVVVRKRTASWRL
jgi:hypothetical protein